MPCYDWFLEPKEGKNKHQINRFDAVSILVETKISSLAVEGKNNLN